MRSVWFSLIIFCLVLPVVSTAAENAANPAQGPRLQVRCLTGCCRHQAPIPLELTFDGFDSRPVMAGVELVFSQGCVLSRYRTDKLVITGPRTRFLVTVPPLEISGLRPSGKNRPVRVDKFLLLDDRRVNFGYDLIAAGGESERSLVVGVVRITGTGTTACAPLLQALRLELYILGNAGQKAVEFPASTQVAGILPQYLPQCSLGWCAFDVVVLPEDGFKALTPSQLAALYTWIRAGGSVAVFCGMALPDSHVRFLNQLAGGLPGMGLYSRAGDGRMRRPGTEDGQKIFFHYTGLGRSVIVTAGDGAELRPQTWRRACGFLWKLHRKQAASVRDCSIFAGNDKSKVSGRTNRTRRRRYWGGVDDYGDYLPIGDILLRRLLPANINMIPLWTIVVIMLGLAVLIGPIDYWILGKLGKRRLTWVTFPCMTIGATLFTMFLADRAMGRTSSASAMEIIDLDATGQVLRDNRFEVVFSGKSVQAKRKFKRVCFTPLDRDDFSNGYYRYHRGSDRRGGPDQELPPCYIGRYPEKYELAQDVRQWDPRINRIMRLGPGPVNTRINWAGIDPDWLRDENGCVQLYDFLKSRFRDSGQRLLKVWVFGRQRLYDVIQRKSFEPKKVFLQLFSRDNYYYGYYHGNRFNINVLPLLVLYPLCRRPASGIFNYVTQVSPHAGASFEDLALLDPDDFGQRMLVVIARAGKDTVVYRMLFREQ